MSSTHIDTSGQDDQHNLVLTTGSKFDDSPILDILTPDTRPIHDYMSPSHAGVDDLMNTLSATPNTKEEHNATCLRGLQQLNIHLPPSLASKVTADHSLSGMSPMERFLAGSPGPIEKLSCQGTVNAVKENKGVTRGGNTKSGLKSKGDTFRLEQP